MVNSALIAAPKKKEYVERVKNPYTGKVETIKQNRPFTEKDFDEVFALFDQEWEEKGAFQGAKAKAGVISKEPKKGMAAVQGFNISNKIRDEADYQKQNKFGDPKSEGLEGIPLPPTSQVDAIQQIRRKTGAQVQKGAQAFTSAVGGAAQLGAALATGGASSLATVGLEGIVGALFGPPGEADAAFALLPSVLRGSKGFMNAVKARDAAKAKKFIQEARLSIAERQALERYVDTTETTVARGKRVKQPKTGADYEVDPTGATKKTTTNAEARNNEWDRDYGKDWNPPKTSAKMEPDVKGSPPNSGSVKAPVATGAKAPKVETPPKTVAHADVDQVREFLGFKKRETAPETLAGWQKEAEQFKGKELGLVEKGKSEKLGHVEQTALGKRLYELVGKIEKSADPTDYDAAFIEAEQIADALDKAGTEAGRSMRSRQMLHDVTYTDFGIKRKATKANLGEEVDPKTMQELESARLKLREAEKTIANQDARISRLMADFRAPVTKAERGTPTARRREAISRLSRRLPDVRDPITFKSKKQGSARLTGDILGSLGKDIRTIARSYVQDGSAKSFDDVMVKLEKDTHLDKDELLYFLSGEHRKAKLDTDVAKMEIDKSMRNIEQMAIRRNRGPLKNAALDLLDVVTTTQKALGAGGEMSMALIQGKNILQTNPSAWVKGMAEGFKAVRGGEKAIMESAAKIKNDPMYSRIVKGGYRLTEVGGPLQGQEEYMASRILSVLDKGKVGKVLGLNPWTRSQHFTTAMMNEARYRSIKFLAMFDPDNPEYIKDVVNAVNILSGRGSGKFAESLSHVGFQNIGYAPRFAYSGLQYATGMPIFGAKTLGGKAAGLSMYASKALWITGLMTTARMFGWPVETDIRSKNYGYAKIGPYMIDFFGKEADVVKFVAREFYGGVSEKGNYTSPVDFGSKNLEQFVSGKAAPVPRTLYEVAHGKLEETPEGEWSTRPIAWSDVAAGLVPMTWRDIKENTAKADAPVAGKSGVGLFQFLGGSAKRVKPQTGKKQAPPLKPLEIPGLQPRNFK